ncbi:MAG TPA: hypothetical protein P5274_01285, partial [Candidatus Paceibacterota bacterium]|nr:hypothetical protein [Candidatus Paceibacterota bacterium]
MLLLLLPFVTSASVTQQINYQGKLTDSSGNVVADGTYAIEFKIYDDPTAGSVLWTENHTGANEITITDGLFSVMLGSITSLSSVDFNQALYLSINVESDGEMSPRKTLGTVPNSLNSLKFDGLASTSVAVLNRENVFTATTTLATTTISYLSNDLSVGGGVRDFTYLQMSTANATTTAYGVALGYQAQSTGANSVALGYQSIASGLRSIALGKGEATAADAIAIGYNAAAAGDTSLSIGVSSWAQGDYSFALGYLAQSPGENSVAIGPGSYSPGYESIAFINSSAEATSSVSFMGAQVKTPYTFGINLDGTTPDIYATSTFYIANGDFFVEGTTTLGNLFKVDPTSTTNKYLKTSLLDLTSSGLGDLGYYPMLSGYSDGTFGNITMLDNNVAIYDTNDDDLETISFVGNGISSIGSIEYDNSSHSFAFKDLLTDANITVTGNVGIGTTTPAYKLTVNSTNGTDNLFQIATTTNQNIFTIQNDGVARFGSNLVVSSTGTSTFAGGINLTSGCLAIGGVCLTGGGGTSQWMTAGSDIYYTTGKVSVGTATPSAS